ncbi:MAG: NAD(P)/FAD-dependent oxidoreductase [Candidatus Eremiobacteraeota bacterium]|nr:NAD(P)/FAD-dependent oxidoreductase [Candidatus Eremiobacteraeota bacterium]
MEKGCDVAIVGGGPAGLSAALMLGRARRAVLLIDDGGERNLSVRESHGFLGYDGCSPRELLARARVQLETYSTITHVSDHVDAIEGAIDRFEVHLRSGETVLARRIIFATGVRDDLPEIDGVDALWGKRIFVCPYCDGWEFRDRRIAIVGNTRTALELAQELWTWSRDLVVCSTKGMPLPEQVQTWQAAAAIDVIESRPDVIREQDEKVIIDCAGGEHVECDVVFMCAPLKQHSKLPEVLGCELTERGTIKTDAENRTTVAGCFAAGDCVTKYHQIAFAAASATCAAIAINEEFYTSDAQALIGGRQLGSLAR